MCLRAFCLPKKHQRVPDLTLARCRTYVRYRVSPCTAVHRVLRPLQMYVAVAYKTNAAV